MKVLLFAHARSGSSTLLRLLNLHPRLRLAEEPFHHHYRRWNPQERNYVDHIHDIPTLESALDAIFSRYNGLKVLQYQLPEPLYTHLLLQPELQVLFLRRRNLLQAAVSGRMAEQTGVWKIWDLTAEITQVYGNLQPISPDHLREILTYDRQSMAEYEAVVDRRDPARTVKLWYEDLYTPDLQHNRQLLGQVFEAMGLSLPISPAVDVLLDPRRTRLNSRQTYAMLPNAAEIDAALGSDETGWLLAD